MFLRRVEIFRHPGGTRSDSIPGQTHRRPSAPAQETAGANDHALGRHRQLERRAPLLRRESSSKKAGAVSSSTAQEPANVPCSPDRKLIRCISPCSIIYSQRPEVDATRIAAVGASFGGHWSTKLAHLAPDKLRAAVNWGGGIHHFFQPEWQERSRHADSYLFDLIEARANLFGKKTFEELCAVMPALSLLDQGWLDKPCAPLLIVNGKEDKQVPLEDFYLFLEHGNPKAIRLFPGGHMGAIPNIFKTVSTGCIKNWTESYEPLSTAKTPLSRQSRRRAARALSPGRRRRSSRTTI